jgi:hypothetical protein
LLPCNCPQWWRRFLLVASLPFVLLAGILLCSWVAPQLTAAWQQVQLWVTQAETARATDVQAKVALLRRAQPTGDAPRAAPPDLSVRRGQAVDDVRAVRRSGQDGPERDACLRIPVDVGRPLPVPTLLALEAACHTPALWVKAGYTQERTLAEVLYGPLPAAAPRPR